MKDQITNLIKKIEEDSREIIGSSVTTPETHNLFKVDISSVGLDKQKSEFFHSTTASLLYIMKRARPDIETGVSFLMRRVSKTDNDDWIKLKRVLSFLYDKIEDERMIGATSLTEILTWINTTYAVHNNTRSHMGG